LEELHTTLQTTDSSLQQNVLIFSQLTNLEMTIKFDVATCIDHVTRSQNIHVEFNVQLLI